jgi:hypothetical protein
MSSSPDMEETAVMAVSSSTNVLPMTSAAAIIGTFNSDHYFTSDGTISSTYQHSSSFPAISGFERPVVRLRFSDPYRKSIAVSSSLETDMDWLQKNNTTVEVMSKDLRGWWYKRLGATLEPDDPHGFVAKNELAEGEYRLESVEIVFTRK